MALQINPNLGSPTAGNDANTKADAPAIGTPNQDAANQLADLLKNPAQDSGAPAPTGSPFSTPFKSLQNPDKKAAESASSPFNSSSQTESRASTDTQPNTTSPFNTQNKSNTQTTSTGSEATNTSVAPQGSSGSSKLASDVAEVSTVPETSILSAAANVSNSDMSLRTSSAGASVSPASLGEIKESAKPGSEALSESQLAAAASMQSAAGVQSSGVVSATGAVEEVAQPQVDGEKIQKMMDSVTKELGMRDLSQLKLGGEMTLKLDQGALPNTEVKVRFEGDQMVISIDSQTADVNQFCTDNLALLQQSVSSGMKDEMKVRIEVRNPPDQPNQRKDGQSGGNGQGGGGSSSGNSQQQSKNSEGDSLEG